MGRSGLLSSAAAAVSLMVASVVVLLAMSSMIAFKGWPGHDSSVRESRDSVAMSSVQDARERSRQRVVLGGRSPRPAAGRPAWPRRRAQPQAGQKVARVQSTTSGPQPAAKQRPQGEVLGVTVSGSGASAPEGGAPAPSTVGRDTEPTALETVADTVGSTADGLLGDPERGARPVGELIDALKPKTP